MYTHDDPDVAPCTTQITVAAERERQMLAEIDALKRELAAQSDISDVASDERDRAWRAEIDRLRGKCNRLQACIRELDRGWSESEGAATYTDDEIVDVYELRPGDLDPEPHGTQESGQ